MQDCTGLCTDISNLTSLVLFSIPGIPGAHQLTGVVLIGMDGGQHVLTATEEKHRIETDWNTTQQVLRMHSNQFFEQKKKKILKPYDNHMFSGGHVVQSLGSWISP